MLELLVTSHGSSESCGVKQGTGCSRGLRAINIPDAEDSVGPKRERENKKREEKDKKNKVGEEKQRKEKTDKK